MVLDCQLLVEVGLFLFQGLIVTQLLLHLANFS